MAARLDDAALDLDGSDATSTNTAATADTEAPAAPKRGRGRPRKNPTAGGDTAPRREETAARGPGRPSNAQKLEKSLTDQFGAIALMVMMLDPRVGSILLEDATQHAAALAKLAEQNPKVRKMLEGGLNGSAWFGVIVAFGSTGYRIVQATKQPPEQLTPTEHVPFGAGGGAVPVDFGRWSTYGTGTDGR